VVLPISDPLLIRVYDAARAECLGRGDLCTGSAHVLLALLAFTPDTELASRGVDRAAVEARLESLLAPHRGADAALMGPRGCWTPRAKGVLSVAASRATARSAAVELSDVWVGLWSDPDSEAVRVLRECGATR
jgi:hypothetical protein